MKTYVKIKTIIKFDDIETQKLKFHQHKGPIWIRFLLVKKDLNNLSVTKMIKKIRPLCIFLPKMNAYRKDFGESKSMSFLIKDYDLLEKYNKIWEKAIKKEFDSELYIMKNI